MHHQGYVPSTVEELDALFDLLGKSQGSCEFGDLAPPLKGSGRGKLSLPFLSVERFAPGCFDQEAQTGPDCTSHGTRNAADISRAVEIDIRGEAEEWIARGATEPIFGARGHRTPGYGMSPTKAAMFLHNFGHLLRLKYPFADLSKYDFNIGFNWGGPSGPPKEVRDEAAKHPFRYQARIRAVEEARDALANGYGLLAGSKYGSDMIRNERGIWTFNSSWNHVITIGGCDDAVINKDDLWFLGIQSWGRCSRGPKADIGKTPDGSGMIPSRDMEWIIKNGEVYVLGDFDGFKLKDLPDYGAGDFLG